MIELEALGTSDTLKQIGGERDGKLYPVARFRERETKSGGTERISVFVFDRHLGEREIGADEFHRYERKGGRTANTPERETPPELIKKIYGRANAGLSRAK